VVEGAGAVEVFDASTEVAGVPDWLVAGAA
jgi:hypothetical protein